MYVFAFEKNYVGVKKVQDPSTSRRDEDAKDDTISFQILFDMVLADTRNVDDEQKKKELKTICGWRI